MGRGICELCMYCVVHSLFEFRIVVYIARYDTIASLLCVLCVCQQVRRVSWIDSDV